MLQQLKDVIGNLKYFFYLQGGKDTYKMFGVLSSFKLVHGNFSSNMNLRFALASTFSLFFIVVHSSQALELISRSSTSSGTSSQDSTLNPTAKSLCRALQETLNKRVLALKASQRLLKKVQRDPRNSHKAEELRLQAAQLHSWALDNAMHRALHAEAQDQQSRLKQVAHILQRDREQQEEYIALLQRLKPHVFSERVKSELEELSHKIHMYGHELDEGESIEEARPLSRRASGSGDHLLGPSSTPLLTAIYPPSEVRRKLMQTLQVRTGALKQAQINTYRLRRDPRNIAKSLELVESVKTSESLSVMSALEQALQASPTLFAEGLLEVEKVLLQEYTQLLEYYDELNRLTMEKIISEPRRVRQRLDELSTLICGGCMGTSSSESSSNVHQVK